MGGAKAVSVRADSTCVDAAAATAAAERMVTSDGVAAIMGADCSGVTTAVLQNVGTAKGIVMISPLPRHRLCLTFLTMVCFSAPPHLMPVVAR